MLSLSTRGEYGVRAMFEIAREYEKGPVSIKEIARRQGVSVPYLEQLLNRLRRAGLIRSQKGPGGGYVLIKRPDEITIGVILRVLEGPVALTNCLAPVSDRHRCSLVKKCVARLLWQSLGEKIEEFLEGITLQDLLSASADMDREGTEARVAR
jgi:Rrf2 family protein